MKRTLTITFFLCFFSYFCFSETFGLEILKKSSLSFEAPVAFLSGDLSDYSEGAYGFEVKSGTELTDFNSEKVSLGLCSTFFYNEYFPLREEFKTFYIRGFTEGLYVDVNFPHRLILRNEINAGLGFTKAEAEGIANNSVEGEYNSLVIGFESVLTWLFLDTKHIAFGLNAGLFQRFLKEEDSLNSQTGIKAGITVMGGKKWR